MREHEHVATLRTAFGSLGHIVDLTPHALEHDGEAPRDASVSSPTPTPTPSRHDRDRDRQQHHVSKTDHFRRLEDRMDQLHDEMLATQRLVQELTESLGREKRSEATRQTFRTISGKALQTARGPGGLGLPGVGPSASLPMAATFFSTLSPSSSKSKGSVEQLMLSSERDEYDTAPATAAIEPWHHASGGRDELREMHVRKPSRVEALTASHTRKLSASNPVSLLPSKHGESKHVVSMAVAHAATFIAEVTNAASVKKLVPKPIVAEPLPIAAAGLGPEMSRRFSISSLDSSVMLTRGNRVSRAFQWSRNLFRPRNESAVSPEEIQDARRDYAKHDRFTIRHDSAQRMAWDVIVTVLIIVDIVITPLSLSFRFFPHGIDAYNTVGNVIFAADFFVNMLSSYTTPRGVLVSGPRRTMHHYLLSPWALPDFLSWFPFESLVQSEQSRFLGIAKVIRLAKVSQLARRLHSAKKAGFFRFIKLLGTVFIVSHCLSCYWNWVAADWRMEEDGYLDKTLGQQYAHCWSLVIGSLNASPPAMHSTVEEVSVAFFMLIGNVLQATVFGSVAVLIQSFDEEEVAYNKKLINTYERCRFLDIPEKLARRIQGYYENLYQETRSVDPDADAFINELSPALICEVKFQLYRDMIKQIPFLSATNINPVVIEMLILHLRTVIYMQDDVLIRKGEVGDWMGFIGSKGSVGVLDPKSEVRKIIRILRKGDYFGEMALLQRAKRSTTAIALTWVQIHVLCRNDLDDVKAQYPEQAEILEEEINKYMQTKVTYK